MVPGINSWFRIYWAGRFNKEEGRNFQLRIRGLKKGVPQLKSWGNGSIL